MIGQKAKIWRKKKIKNLEKAAEVFYYTKSKLFFGSSKVLNRMINDYT